MVVLLVIYVPNIKEVFGLAGASVATMLVIIMPAGFYYLVSSISESHSMTHAWVWNQRKILSKLVTLPLIFFLAWARGKNINEEKNQFGCCWFRCCFCNFLNWINHLRMVPPTHSWRTMQKTSRFYHFMISLEYIYRQQNERAWISTNLTLLRLLMVPTVNKYWNLILFFCS